MREHAGKELDLMLAAKKPLAMFYYCRALEDRDLLPIDEFAPYVEDGKILMQEYDPPMPPGSDPRYQITFVFYALPTEAWRIPAIKIAVTAQNENYKRPDEGIDRIIGMLLGYPKHEIDSWIRSGLDAGAYK